MMTLALLVFCATFGSGVISTWLVERYARHRRLLDHPSERGLHDQATPRGGGAAILLTVSGALIVLHGFGLAGWFGTPLLIAVGIAYGALGWLDDHSSLPIVPRLLAQFVFASVFVAANGAGLLAPVTAMIDLPDWLGLFIVVVAIAGFVNLFNFMDGADGYAGGVTVAATASGAVIAGLTGDHDTLLATLAIAGAATGFLVWNWQPARIFMGDVGSYFLGFQFCALTAHDVLAGRGAWVWIILLAPFITDGVLTLGRRVWRRERFWRAHRAHAYQVLILSGLSHARVCVAITTLTVCVLAPVAMIARLQPSHALTLTAAVYGLNVMLWLAAQRRSRNVTTSAST
ncbi:MAG: MraY family glycosyltransferase [Gammaproteobacteria bacterium]|jgi:Fuc2NAc and GlcNAc transferase